MSPKTMRIFGPPGTGKTTALLDVVERHLREGVPAHEIGFMAFTRAAAREAKNRALQVFPWLDSDDLRWFRTIHSACYSLLGLGRGSVATGAKLRDFALQFGYEMSPPADRDPEDFEVQEMMLRTLGDYLLFFEDWRRNLMLWDITEAYNRFLEPVDWPDGWSLQQVREFHQRYRQWKADNGLVDFADMLMLVLRDRVAPPVSVLIVDEMQDLSPLQAEVIRLWASGARLLYLAGDPDQAIYTFNGADPGIFLNWPHDDDRQLTQSHRVPQTVHEIALRLIRRNRERVDVPYKPQQEEGYVRFGYLNSLPIETLAQEGSVLLLARNRYLLSDFTDALVARGLPFEALRGSSPLRTGVTSVILAGTRLTRGERVSIADAARFVDALPSDRYLVRGAKARMAELARQCPEADIAVWEMEPHFKPSFWDLLVNRNGSFIEALRLPPLQRAYYKKLLERGGERALLDAPRIKVGTIHSAKGMEADFVVLRPEMAGRTYAEWLRAPEGERRCWYVGLTRARKGLWLLEPAGMRAIDWRLEL
ncbi:MAG TPA: ATP-dependent helicase [Dehalococcoidia bacterium]|nr:ATP-dependent helicase [Dehalococcoidia bacterium]